MCFVDSLPRDVGEDEDVRAYRIVPECIDVVSTLALVLSGSSPFALRLNWITVRNCLPIMLTRVKTGAAQRWLLRFPTIVAA